MPGRLRCPAFPMGKQCKDAHEALAITVQRKDRDGMCDETAIFVGG